MTEPNEADIKDASDTSSNPGKLSTSDAHRSPTHLGGNGCGAVSKSPKCSSAPKYNQQYPTLSYSPLKRLRDLTSMVSHPDLPLAERNVPEQTDVTHTGKRVTRSRYAKHTHQPTSSDASVAAACPPGPSSGHTGHGSAPSQADTGQHREGPADKGCLHSESTSLDDGDTHQAAETDTGALLKGKGHVSDNSLLTCDTAGAVGVTKGHLVDTDPNTEQVSDAPREQPATDDSHTMETSAMESQLDPCDDGDSDCGPTSSAPPAMASSALCIPFLFHPLR